MYNRNCFNVKINYFVVLNQLGILIYFNIPKILKILKIHGIPAHKLI